MSTQPSVGGPIYFIRNIVYHAPGGSTRITAGSPGVFFYNNTILSQHSVLVDYDLFVNVARLDAKDLLRVQRLYKAADMDFRLKPGSAAVDRGVALPNITDGFSGQAPNLGAQTMPVYGPRPQ